MHIRRLLKHQDQDHGCLLTFVYDNQGQFQNILLNNNLVDNIKTSIKKYFAQLTPITIMYNIIQYEDVIELLKNHINVFFAQYD